MLSLLAALLFTPLIAAGTFAAHVHASKDIQSPPSPELSATPTPSLDISRESLPDGVAPVPFYSQFTDISRPEWRKVGCGIASLSMIVDFYTDTDVSVDALLQEGIAQDAYLDDAGWIHAGLIGLAGDYGLTGTTNDLRTQTNEAALATLSEELKEGPVMASVHYRFDPESTIPHLVVVNGITDTTVYVNDPAANGGQEVLTIAEFMRGWKKRYIEIRPTTKV